MWNAMRLLEGREGWKPEINLIQADSRGNWEALPSSWDGKCQDNDHRCERWALWPCAESPRIGRAYREERKVEPLPDSTPQAGPGGALRGFVLAYLWPGIFFLSLACTFSSLPNNSMLSESVRLSTKLIRWSLHLISGQWATGHLWNWL